MGRQPPLFAPRREIEVSERVQPPPWISALGNRGGGDIKKWVSEGFFANSGAASEGRPLGREKILRHRWHSRPGQHPSDDGRGGPARRPGRRAAVPHRRRPSPSGGDRQGHAPVRLYDRAGAGGGPGLGRHGRAHLRPPADAGRGDDDPLDARRSGHHDLGLAQRLRRQRHQAVRTGRLQAVGRDRAEDRSHDGRGPGSGPGALEQAGPGQADRRRAAPLYRNRQTGLPQAAEPEGPAHRHRLRQRRRLPRGPDDPL